MQQMKEQAHSLYHSKTDAKRSTEVLQSTANTKRTALQNAAGDKRWQQGIKLVSIGIDPSSNLCKKLFHFASHRCSRVSSYIRICLL